MKARESEAARRILGRRYATLGAPSLLTPPPRGWVRAVRDALGMSLADLGGRMGVTAPSVAALETSEQQGTAQLDTLRRAADAMDCDLVYALIPRTSLDATVHAQARAKIAREVAAVEHSMGLEDQAAQVSDEIVDEEIRLLVRSGRLWK